MWYSWYIIVSKKTQKGGKDHASLFNTRFRSTRKWKKMCCNTCVKICTDYRDASGCHSPILSKVRNIQVRMPSIRTWNRPFPIWLLATVYNNLKVLIEEGFVSRNKSTQWYTTLVTLWDTIILNPDLWVLWEDWWYWHREFQMWEQKQRKSGYVITKCQTTVYGLCPECQKQQ